MIKSWGAATLTAALLCTASTALAKEKEAPNFWAGCGQSQRSSLSIVLMIPTKDVAPSDIIQRCTADINALAADAPWEQRAAYLRSRAISYVSEMRPKEALADLDAIAAIERPNAAYSRSFGVSLHMLRALALTQEKRPDEAAAYAIKAMQARPWSARVGQFAFMLALFSTNPINEPNLWNRLLVLEPDMKDAVAAYLRQTDDWNASLNNLLTAKIAPGEIETDYIKIANVTVTGAAGVPIKGVNISRSVNAIITAHVAGRPDLAEKWLAATKTNLAVKSEPSPIEKMLNISISPEQRLEAFGKMSDLIEAAALFGKGDFEGAAKRLDTTKELKFRGSAVVFLRDLLGKLPANSHSDLRARYAQALELDQQEKQNRLKNLAAEIDIIKLLSGLPDHEDAKRMNAYKTNNPLSSKGSSAKLSKDKKSAEIEFFGDKTNEIAIEEMALLRAAETTLEQGKSAFRISSNRAYVQTSTLTMNGSPIGPSTVSGKGSKMNIEFVDPAAPGDTQDTIQAGEVVAALAPIYKKPKGK